MNENISAYIKQAAENAAQSSLLKKSSNWDRYFARIIPNFNTEQNLPQD